MTALSIRQPWAWLIVNGFKLVENRDRPTSYRGAIDIPTGKKLDIDAHAALMCGEHPVTGQPLPGLDYPPLVEGKPLDLGGIVGVAEIYDCIQQSDDEWFVGPFGYLMRKARPVPFKPCLGALGFFDPDRVFVRRAKPRTEAGA